MIPSCFDGRSSFQRISVHEMFNICPSVFHPILLFSHFLSPLFLLMRDVFLFLCFPPPSLTLLYQLSPHRLLPSSLLSGFCDISIPVWLFFRSNSPQRAK